MKTPPLFSLFLRLAYQALRAIFAFLLIASLIVLPPFLSAIH